MVDCKINNIKIFFNSEKNSKTTSKKLGLDVDRDVAISRPRIFLFSILTSLVLTRRERKSTSSEKYFGFSEFAIISIYDRILNLSEFKSDMVKDGNLTIYFGLKLPKPESGNWSIRVILHQETNQNDEIYFLKKR